MRAGGVEEGGGAGAALARTALSSWLSFHVLTPVDGTRACVPVEPGAPFLFFLFFLLSFSSQTGRDSFQPTRHVGKKKNLLHFRRLSREENADINKPGSSALGPGISRSTSDFLSGYSRVQTVQGSACGNALTTWGVSGGQIDRQKDSWGLSDMSLLIW